MYAVIVALGLVVGSFLNVCIWRMPRGESVVFPPSGCPSCGARIRPWDNVPVLSYIFLLGKCRKCKAGISPRYPLVEALNALLYFLAFHVYGLGWHIVPLLVFVSVLVVITFIDLDHQIIPDRITLPGIALGLLCGSLIAPDPFMREAALGWPASVAGAASGFAMFYAIALMSRGGMGGGDIKFMAMAGSLLGWKGVLLTTFAGSFSGSVLGLFLVAFKGKGRKTKVPFGPFLALGCLITLFAGQEILGWYLNVGD
jgi:leader peptidase (prepilin peptidase)/N-methyltransferase